MNSKKKIKSNEYNISKLEEFSNIIFDANKNNKLWQTINMFLIGFDIGSKDLTKFSKFVIFNDYYKNTLFLKEYGITNSLPSFQVNIPFPCFLPFQPPSYFLPPFQKPFKEVFDM